MSDQWSFERPELKVDRTLAQEPKRKKQSRETNIGEILGPGLASMPTYDLNYGCNPFHAAKRIEVGRASQ